MIDYTHMPKVFRRIIRENKEQGILNEKIDLLFKKMRKKKEEDSDAFSFSTKWMLHSLLL